jgi:hypothetical protein
MYRLYIPFLMLILSLSFPSNASADISPPYNPPGVNPEPGAESTQVRMVAETVTIEVRNEGELGRARVTADFRMRNLGSETERLAVRFPIASNNGRGEFPEITNLSIKLDESRLDYRRVDYPDIEYANDEVPWAEFDVTFPPAKDVALQLAYDLEGSGYDPYTAFYYILHTGAGWKDTIGSAEVILRLPYAASPQNVVMGLQIGWVETTRGGLFQGNEVRWRFEDFEPGADGPVQDMQFALVSPRKWTALLKEQENVSKSPGDGEAWGRLGKSYKEIFFLTKGYRTDPAGEEIFASSLAAYETCLAIKPDDAQWHAGFAELLINRSYWDAGMGAATPDTVRALEEIQTALRLAPRDPLVLEVAGTIQSMFPEGMTNSNNGYEFPWLTRTPTVPPPTPTIVPAFDAASISGVYLSEELALETGPARLRLTLNPDHTLRLATETGSEPAAARQGSWLDLGDGRLEVLAHDEYGAQVEFIFFVEGEKLDAYQYPGSYGEGGIELTRVEPDPPSPEDTPGPDRTDSGPGSGAAPELCGSAALAPLIMVWLMQKPKPGRTS